MRLDTKLRAQLADRVLSCLGEAVPGSKALLRGSLAGNRADQYSDIDVLWEVPNSHFGWGIDSLKKVLSGVHPIESLRWDPDTQGPERRRLAFVRFEGVPLFWRLDLEIHAKSTNRDREFEPHISKSESSEWSLTESALMNAVAAAKAHLRDNDDEAKQLLFRGYQRVGLSMPRLELRDLILGLAHQVKVMDPKSVALAERVKNLVSEISPQRWVTLP